MSFWGVLFTMLRMLDNWGMDLGTLTQTALSHCGFGAGVGMQGCKEAVRAELAQTFCSSVSLALTLYLHFSSCAVPDLQHWNCLGK